MDTFLKNQLLEFGVVFFPRLAPPWVFLQPADRGCVDFKFKHGSSAVLRYVFADQQSTADDISNLRRALRWPASLSLPALDILRLAVLNPKANEVLFQASIIEDLFSLLLISVKSNKNDNCLMLAIRTIANMFSHKKGK